MWGCFLMSGVKILHFLKDWWKSIPIHQNYTMALRTTEEKYSLFIFAYQINLVRSSPDKTQSQSPWECVFNHLA